MFASSTLVKKAFFLACAGADLVATGPDERVACRELVEIPASRWVVCSLTRLAVRE